MMFWGNFKISIPDHIFKVGFMKLGLSMLLYISFDMNIFFSLIRNLKFCRIITRLHLYCFWFEWYDCNENALDRSISHW